jgi:predicted RNA methylase
MSSTNRGGKRSPADDYPTPAWCVHRFMEEESVQDLFSGCSEWLEPGAGDGAIIQAVNYPAVNWTALELRQECLQPLTEAVGKTGTVIIGDFLSGSHPYPQAKYDVAIGNPPYRLAEAFVQKSLELADTVAFLLRLNFLASARRNAFMRSRTPDVYVLPNRPSFSSDGATDSPEYGWFVWSLEAVKSGRPARLRILKTTPKEER